MESFKERTGFKDKKYELTGELLLYGGVKLHRIRAVRDFTLCNGATVRAGELGGWLENDGNLSHLGSAWVCGDAMVYGSAMVYGDAVLRCGVKVKKTTDYVLAGPAGSRAAVTTFVPGDDMVFCGCFSGTLEEFAARVEETHEGQALFLSQYRSMVQFFRWMRETQNVLERRESK